MSLAHAILGLLQQEKMTGYDLKINCFDQCIAHLWPADQAQIYRTLDKLEAQGWITCTVEIQRDRPNRKVYSTTEAGKAELIRWLQCPQPLPTVREPLLVQLFFAAQLPNEAIINLLKQQLVVHGEKMVNCQAIKVLPLNDASVNREQVMHQLVLDLITQREQTYIDWLKTAIEVIGNN
ncbi:PadR family transcriptional regulator [Nostocaceae cyanobacterium CENA357]|uniref:PadR family transcriptional regulator n=1 Tax=Atlanticothrix silvestris CENA357 TaxID=1725252 RepID=A0A8J7L4I4_9CYAN|nr:PadR family transcriptional regulator [Atlanticothrix silvestris]MBH8552052.1 PadR family transcriptional regulator [Atlanticothrix silvestris CENA357]